MNPTLHYLFGKLSATVEALKIEGTHLTDNVDEDEHKRLAKLIEQLDQVVTAMGEIELIPKQA